MQEIWETYKHDIIKGFFTGIFGGIGVFIIKAFWDWLIICRDKKRVLNFLRANTAFTWYTTHRIASGTDLTESRVAFICSVSKKIKRNQKQNETWALK